MSPALVVAYATAGLSGFLLTVAMRQRTGAHARQRRMKASMRAREDPNARTVAGVLPESGIVGLLRRSGEAIQPSWLRAVSQMRVWGIGCADLPAMLARAGIADAVSPEAVRILRVRMVLTGIFVGALMGAVFSVEDRKSVV